MFCFNRIYTFQASSVLGIKCTSIFLIHGARKSQQSPRNEDTERYLLDQFQVAKRSARLLSKVCTVSDIAEREQYFKSIALTQEHIGLVFKKSPRKIMTCQVAEMEKNVNFLSGYTTQFRDPNVLISHLIPQYPLLLSHPIDVMEKRIRLLEKYNLNKEEIAKVLR
jgi:hypothetical protein